MESINGDADGRMKKQCSPTQEQGLRRKRSSRKRSSQQALKPLPIIKLTST